MIETLYHCPYCWQGGFTGRGLRAHVCHVARNLAEGQTGQQQRRLTADEVKQSIERQKRQAVRRAHGL